MVIRLSYPLDDNKHVIVVGESMEERYRIKIIKYGVMISIDYTKNISILKYADLLGISEEGDSLNIATSGFTIEHKVSAVYEDEIIHSLKQESENVYDEC